MKKVYTLNTRMKSARLKYGATKHLMSSVLGFGVNQWGLYEDGKEIESQVHKHLIESAITPYGFINYLERYPHHLRENANYKKVFKKVNQICEEIKKHVDKQANNLADAINTEFTYDTNEKVKWKSLSLYN